MQFEGVAFARSRQAFNVEAVATGSNPLWRRYFAEVRNSQPANDTSSVSSQFFDARAFLLPRAPLPAVSPEAIAETRARILDLVTPPPGIAASRIYRPAPVVPLAKIPAPRVVIPAPLPEAPAAPAPVAETPAAAPAPAVEMKPQPKIEIVAEATVTPAVVEAVVAVEAPARPRGTLSLKSRPAMGALKAAPQQDNTPPPVSLPERAAGPEAPRQRETLRARGKVDLPSIEGLSRNSSFSQFAAAFRAGEKLVSSVDASEAFDVVQKAFAPAAAAAKKSWADAVAEVSMQPKKTYRNVDISADFKKGLQAALARDTVPEPSPAASSLSAKSSVAFERASPIAAPASDRPRAAPRAGTLTLRRA